MPGNNVIDRLSIEFEAEASRALKSTGRLVSALRHVRDSISDLSGAKISLGIGSKTGENLQKFSQAFATLNVDRFKQFVDTALSMSKFNIGIGEKTGANLRAFSDALNSVNVNKMAEISAANESFHALGAMGIGDKTGKNLQQFASAINMIDTAKLREFSAVNENFNSITTGIGQKTGENIANFAAGLNQLNLDKLRELSTIDFTNMKILGEAAQHIKGLAKALETLSRMSERADEAQKLLGRSIRRTGSNAGGAIGKIKKFLHTIKRVVMLRVVRNVLRAIAQGFGEGIQNLYYWSQAFGTTFAPAMDRLATSTLYLKNGFASMFSPLIEYAIPILDRVIDKVVDFFNFVQEGFAQITGASTWNRALKYPVNYADALDDASKSAKAFKNQLMGFDELNVINTPSDSSRGRAADVEDYSKMFELVETAAGNNFENLGERLANAVNNVFDDPEKWRDWGGKIADFVSTGFDNAISFLENVDWVNVGRSISSFVSEFTKRIAKKIKDTDWGDVVVKLTEALCNVIEGTDTNELLKSFAKLFAAIATALPSIFLASIESALNVIAKVLEKIGWGGAADKVRGWSNGIKDFRKGYEKARGIVLDALWNQLDYGSVMPNSTRGFEYDPTQDQGRSFDSSGSVIGQMASKDGMQLKMDIVTFLNDEESSFTQTYNKFKEFVDGAKALGAKLVFPIVFTMARIVPKVQEKWNEFKQWWTDKKAEIKLWVASIKDKVIAKWNEFVTWWSQKKEEIKLIAPSIKALVQQKWTEFTNWWSLVKADLNARFTAPDIKSKVLAGWNTFQSWFANVKLNFTERFQVPDLVSKISTAWQNLKNWLSWNPLKFNIQTPHLSLAPGYSLNPVQWVKNSATIPKLSVSWYAQGGYLPDSYTLIGAGENGIPEMLGSVNGRSAVAGGAEITGIRDAILSQGEREENLLRQLITAINNKDLNLVANSQTGRWVSKALKSYQGVTG